ncbi:MAG: CidA/LrgA family protein [Lachnospiraceae bacterium]|nr:CidA/LrgA family protein [Lachnospiraceae bacterium]
MKYLYQFTVILAVSWIGEFLHAILPFPFPASIYGLVLMLVFLKTGIIKLSQVKEAGSFLLETMPVMFIPPAVGLLNVAGEVASIAVPLFVISVLSTVCVMVATGKTSDFILSRQAAKLSSQNAADHASNAAAPDNKESGLNEKEES